MKLQFMLPALALAVLAGCAKEQQVVESPAPQKGTFVFTSSTGDATKVALNADNSLYWIAGDQIAVYNYKGDDLVRNDVALITSGEGTSVATFTPNTYTDKTSWYNGGDGDSQAYAFSAFYPGSNATPASKVVSLSNVAAAQSEAAGVGSYIISWASANTTKATLAAGTAPNFAFAPKTAMLKLAIRNSNSSSLTARIESITFTADAGSIAGPASLNLESGALSGGNQSVITYTPSEPIVLAYGATLEMPIKVSLLPNDELTKLTVNFSIPDCTSPAIDLALASHLESGHVYSKLANITSITSTKKVIPTPDPGAKTQAVSGILEANNLYYGTANCIVMAASATSATIDISLKGSSNGYTRSNNDVSATYVSAVAEAKIIWAEADLYNDTAFKITSASATSLTIGKTAGKTGNALVGIYDVNGDLLWSYHVWVPADNSVIEFTGDDKTAVTYSEAFKLALGQIEDEEDTYMWYQWGRKDPLGRANGFSSGNVMVPAYGTAPSTSNKISRTGTGCGANNLSYARQNPWMYIMDDNVSPYDWYPGATSNTQNTNLWNATGTIYDPCPLGYHVLANQTLWKDASSSDLVRDGEDKVIGLRKYGVYYTLGGIRSRASAGVNSVASYGYYWSATVNGTLSRNLYFNTSGDVSPQISNRRANGFGVRCVKD